MITGGKKKGVGLKRAARMLVLAAAALTALSSGAGAQTPKAVGARLCKPYNIETAASRVAAISCDSPYYRNEGGLCVGHSEVYNSFAYILNPDSSIDFGLSWWFGGGAHCGMIGHAAASGEGWRYENNMDAKDPAQRCGLSIVIAGDYMVFEADPGASCRQECGAQALLHNTMIPLKALEKTLVTAEMFNPEVFYNLPCYP